MNKLNYTASPSEGKPYTFVHHAYRVVKQEALWQKAYGNRNNDDPSFRDEYNEYCNQTKDLVATLPFCFNVPIGGVASEGVCHYDVDDFAKEMMPGRVGADSESGQLFIYCNERDRDYLIDLLKVQFPGIKLYGVASEPSDPWGMSLSDARELIEKFEDEYLPRSVMAD
jgi:hypothetical protein